MHIKNRPERNFMSTIKTDRDLRIDLLRVTGLFLIILAHVSPPFSIFQLRSFDVPLMVFISGMAYFASEKKEISITEYFSSRIRRLAFPAWAFLTIFFLTIYICKIEIFFEFLTLSKIIHSYAMVNGIGYVWIMRIFLMIALLSPFYIKISGRFKNCGLVNFSFLMIISASIIFQASNDFSSKFIRFPIDEIILPAISYGALFMLGYRYKSFDTKVKIQIFVISLLALVVIEMFAIKITGGYIYPQDYKYPPQSVYIFYALTTIPLIELIMSKVAPYLSGRIKDSIIYLSSNTIWIYFWHIPIVEYFRISGVMNIFYLKWCIAIILPITVYYFQRGIITYISKKISNKKLSVFIKQTFTG